jgi:enoyl-[acyl-carrier protein] reductase II
MPVDSAWAGALPREVIDGDIETGPVSARQSIGMVTSIEPVAEIIQALIGHAVGTLAARRV